MITVIGNPASRRVKGFAEAAARWGWAVRIISYVDVIRGRCLPPSHGLVRIDSPGECKETARLILAAGIAPLAAEGGSPLGTRAIDRLPFHRGAILQPRQWFFGYREILKQLDAQWSAAPIRWMSAPIAIITAFDKLACLERWEQAVLPVPPRHPRISCYDELRATVTARHARVFLKLRYGYSAMGAIAVEWRGSLVRAITTVEVVAGLGAPRLYVSKRPQLVRCEAEIARLIDWLAAEDCLVEDWLPKARWKGCPFDIRVVVVDGTCCHAVGRANASPFTNLNLDARRIAPDELIAHLGDNWGRVAAVSRLAAQQLPEAGMLGIDILLGPSQKRIALLEANAFGDYLPGLMYRGMSTWDAQLQRLSTGEGVAI